MTSNFDNIKKTVRRFFLFPWKEMIKFCENNPSEWYVKQLADLLTIIRLIAILPLTNYFFRAIDSKNVYNAVFAIFLGYLLASTDAADGEISRKIKLSTTFGKIADPLADKVALIIPLFYLSQRLISKNILAINLVTTLIVVEVILVLIGILGMILATLREIKLGANNFGKIKANSAFALVIGMAILLTIKTFTSLNILVFTNYYITILLASTLLFALLSIVSHIVDLFRPQTQQAD